MPGPCARNCPRFAEQVKTISRRYNLRTGKRSIVAKDYAEAERLALNAAEEAQRADPSHIADALKALELAGWSAQNRIEYDRALNHFRAAAALHESPARCAGMGACAV